MKQYFVYLLESTNHNTYVGATVDLDHRLRQHNGELKGGARATTMKVKKGETWKRVCHIEGFPSWSEALKFEWAWKFYSRKLSKTLFPLDRRKKALETVLSLEKPTSKAIPYNEWETPIKIIWENEENTIYENA
jgi:predicted GIY-YIG superfamily endonuclease